MKPSLFVYSITAPQLFNEADGNTVLLRSLERIDSVTEVLSDDPVLVDAGVYDSLGDNLRPLLRKELVSLGGTSGLVSVTGNANLGVRVGLEGLDNLVDLDLLAVTDVPLVDDEEDVAGKRLECWLNLNFLLNYWFWFWFWLDNWCRSRNRNWCRSWFRLAEAEGKTSDSLDLEVSL